MHIKHDNTKNRQRAIIPLADSLTFFKSVISLYLMILMMMMISYQADKGKT